MHEETDTSKMTPEEYAKWIQDRYNYRKKQNVPWDEWNKAPKAPPLAEPKISWEETSDLCKVVRDHFDVVTDKEPPS